MDHDWNGTTAHEDAYILTICFDKVVCSVVVRPQIMPADGPGEGRLAKIDAINLSWGIVPLIVPS